MNRLNLTGSSTLLSIFRASGRYRQVSSVLVFVCALILSAGTGFTRDIPTRIDISPVNITGQLSNSHYFWKTTPGGVGAEVVTLFCRDCGRLEAAQKDVPLVAVLRDTLDDGLPKTDRLRYVWLLSYSKPKLWQRALSAVPFFYWKVGKGTASEDKSRTAPLIDIASTHSPVLTNVARDVVQWTLFDPMTTGVRASTRAYRTNQMDHERLHLEEAISYLRETPQQPEGALTQEELNTVLARLELRKRLLGGLANEAQAKAFGQQDAFDQERIRARNWETLRQWAEKTGLLFESVNLAGSKGQYAVIWYPAGQTFEESGTRLGPIWKLLNVSDPWTDDRLTNWQGPSFERALDENGTLLPAGEHGKHSVRLIPLSVYNLNYPKLPLLLVDFRDTLHIRRREMTQRTIDDLTAGLLGLSHFANWYYYVGSAAYEFVVNRHGASLDRTARLDCYSQFRVALALDDSVDPVLRAEMQKRVDSLATNPLETSPASEIKLATARYNRLISDGPDRAWLESRLDKDRRAELAQFGQSGGRRLRDSLLHAISLGTYTNRAQVSASNFDTLDRQRRAQSNVQFLDSLVAAGTRPEVAVESRKIQNAVQELAGLSPYIDSADMRGHILNTLNQVKDLSHDPILQADCFRATEYFKTGTVPDTTAFRTGIIAKSSGIAVKPVLMREAAQ